MVKRGVFPQEGQPKMLQMLVLRTGFKQFVLVLMTLYINADIMMAVYYPEGTVIELVARIDGKDSRNVLRMGIAQTKMSRGKGEMIAYLYTIFSLLKELQITVARSQKRKQQTTLRESMQWKKDSPAVKKFKIALITPKVADDQRKRGQRDDCQ